MSNFNVTDMNRVWKRKMLSDFVEALKQNKPEVDVSRRQTPTRRSLSPRKGAQQVAPVKKSPPVASTPSPTLSKNKLSPALAILRSSPPLQSSEPAASVLDEITPLELPQPASPHSDRVLAAEESSVFLEQSVEILADLTPSEGASVPEITPDTMSVPIVDAAELEGRIDSLSEERAALKKALQSAQEQILTLRKASQGRETLEQKVSALADENTTLKMALHSAQKEIVLLQQIAEKEMTELAEMVTMLSRQKREADERLKSSETNSQTEIMYASSLDARVAFLEEELRRRDADVLNYQTKIMQLEIIVEDSERERDRHLQQVGEVAVMALDALAQKELDEASHVSLLTENLRNSGSALMQLANDTYLFEPEEGGMDEGEPYESSESLAPHLHKPTLVPSPKTKKFDSPEALAPKANGQAQRPYPSPREPNSNGKKSTLEVALRSQIAEALKRASSAESRAAKSARMIVELQRDLRKNPEFVEIEKQRNDWKEKFLALQESRQKKTVGKASTEVSTPPAPPPQKKTPPPPKPRATPSTPRDTQTEFAELSHRTTQTAAVTEKVSPSKSKPALPKRVETTEEKIVEEPLTKANLTINRLRSEKEHLQELLLGAESYSITLTKELARLRSQINL